MKKTIFLLMALLLALSSGMAVSAADGKVTYSGNAGQFIFEPGSEDSPTDLFPDLKGVMPGDSLTQKITVKNEASNEVKVKIYIRSLGGQEGSTAFLSQLGLRVKKSEDNEMAYMFDAAADQTAQLTDWVELGTLYSGGVVDLEVLLDVPVTLDNDYQNQIGYLDWEFKIEEFPVEPDDPTPPPTGEETHLSVWLTGIGGAAIVLILLIFWRKKEKESEEDQTA